MSRKNKVMDGTAGLPEYRKRTLRFVQRFSYNGNKEASGFSASEEDLFQGTLREKQEEELKRETETKLPAEENRELKILAAVR